MHLDATAYFRLPASSSLATSAAGAEFATSTGDVLAVACFGAGIFRIRVGASTKPDYGLVVARAQRCEVTQPDEGVWSFAAGGSRLELTAEPLKVRLLHDEHPLLTSVTDEHFRGFTRLPVIGRTRNAAQWLPPFALVSGEPGDGLGQKFGPAHKPCQPVSSPVEDALGVNADRPYKSTPFCWSPRRGAPQ